jgi:hypothetical protein
MTPQPRPRLRRRWFVLALFAGLAAALAAGVWAGGPTWRSDTFGPAFDPAFSDDGAALFTFHGLAPPPGQPCAPLAVRRDAATGAVLGAVPIHWEGPPAGGSPARSDRLWVTRLQGGQRILVGQLSGASPSHFAYYVHDAATGRAATGPLRADRLGFYRSPDGRWFGAAREALLRVLPRPGDRVRWAAFAPGGGRVAVHRAPEVGHGPHAIEVYELPSGREGPRLELPPRDWQRAYEWAPDGRLRVEAQEPDGTGPGNFDRRTYSFGVGDADFGSERAEPLLSGYAATGRGQSFWETGPGWVARLDFPDAVAPLWKRGLLWAAAKLGRSPGVGRAEDLHVRVRFLDPDGAVRSEVPWVPFRYAIAPDARHVAGIGPDGRVEVWQVDRLPPWLWSLAAGVLCGGLVLAVPLILSRRRRPEVAA